MTRHLATIQKILDIQPISGADRIVTATVLGWQCVVKKEEFKVGDMVVYIEVDSVLPEKPDFEFLRDRKFRIKTIKLKKQISQGLIVSMSILPKGKYSEGQDVSDIIGVKKYDPEGEEEKRLVQVKTAKINVFVKYFSRFAWFRKLFGMKRIYKGWPNFIEHTDEDRIQLFPNICNDQETYFEATEKVDGQSATFFLLRKKRFFKDKFEFGVCSRTVRLFLKDNSNYWKMAEKYKIKETLEKLIGDYQFVAIQGECLGKGIQGNKYQLEENILLAFNLIYPKGRIPGSQAAMILNEHRIPFVPILSVGMVLPRTIGECVELAKGESLVTSGVLREGIVVRNYEKNISFKIINPDFLLLWGL
jgi:hypothetical protein